MGEGDDLDLIPAAVVARLVECTAATERHPRRSAWASTRQWHQYERTIDLGQRITRLRASPQPGTFVMTKVRWYPWLRAMRRFRGRAMVEQR
jgi:hypothetical protein